MKLVGIAGSIEDKSYNRLLLKFIANHFSDMVDIEILDIQDVPMFNQSDDQTEGEAVQYLKRKIMQADGVIIATPEHNHTITAALKSVIEWLSFKIHPMSGKPVLIVGASYYDQGSSRAQLNLRQILESPGVDAVVMPGNEFLLGEVKQAFDDQNNLKDARTVSFLQETLGKFLKFVKMVNAMDAEAHADDWKNEDLEAKGEVETTIKGVNMHAADWVEQAAAKTHAAEGDDYVKLDRGVLTVNQLNWFLNSMPMELTYADANNQFLYYNHQMDGDKMLASRTPAQAGNPLADCHPKRAVPGVKRAVHMLRTGETDLFKLPVPGIPNKYVMHYYQALHDDKGEYKGINEFVLDLLPIVKYYLKQTGQMLAPDPDAKTDAVSGASSKAKETKPDAAPAVDDVSGASADTEAAPEAAPEAPTKPEAPDVDSVSGASAK
ncbi:NAD(P)H-dependent oxidoreductase [Lactiplantibacillus plantarum]|uniref:NAD(P)H-dependent oxidoreductase n=1 Tax=Lactiplantibacillus plantarum TaxID=1590 RepID=UPI0007AB9FC8|nr:NAD(P)H-dependent oxidoreductase [Lactiplantibacillus plantarum]ARW12927.1 Fumarate reductase (quinol) [Lactiplantibacillus plantarum subsp. plantarum]ASX22345.1 NADPH-dependent FMN reductase [Lactiplantibacillus plantarum]KZE03948.1 Fumarate reductase flavoprotein subunit precursor [Lactiplantibacillus plantarum]KZT96006.1 Fumarate reductase flavoprotein subunitprecursor [Lactiplantibacillus plantarum]KZU18376.1 Fumarate reductase flavoprotein subunitprecursor [Lactiplantibacillus plantaru